MNYSQRHFEIETTIAAIQPLRNPISEIRKGFHPFTLCRSRLIFDSVTTRPFVRQSSLLFDWLKSTLSFLERHMCES